MTGLLSQKSSAIRHSFCKILVVHLGHGIFHPVAVLVFSTSFFRGGLKLPQKKSGAPLSLHASFYTNSMDIYSHKLTVDAPLKVGVILKVVVFRTLCCVVARIALATACCCCWSIHRVRQQLIDDL